MFNKYLQINKEFSIVMKWILYVTFYYFFVLLKSEFKIQFCVGNVSITVERFVFKYANLVATMKLGGTCGLQISPH